MNSHDHDCCCLQCLEAMADALDAMETMAIAAQIQASWHGWPIDENGPYAGFLPWVPTVPTNGWLAWFAAADAPRRELIRAKVEIVLEAEQLVNGGDVHVV